MKPEHDFSKAKRGKKTGAPSGPASPVVALWMLHKKEDEPDASIPWYPLARLESAPSPHIVEMVVDALPTIYQSALTLKYVEKLDLSEIAIELGIDESKASKLFSRALRTINRVTKQVPGQAGHAVPTFFEDIKADLGNLNQRTTGTEG